jgi:hypothetical protein
MATLLLAVNSFKAVAEKSHQTAEAAGCRSCEGRSGATTCIAVAATFSHKFLHVPLIELELIVLFIIYGGRLGEDELLPPNVHGLESTIREYIYTLNCRLH